MDILAQHDTGISANNALEKRFAHIGRDEEFIQLLELLDQHLKRNEQNTEMIATCWQRITARQLWKTQHADFTDFENAVQYNETIKPVIDKWNNIQYRNNLSLNTIRKQWGRSLLDIIPPSRMPPQPSKNFLDRMAYLSQICPVDAVLHYLKEAPQARKQMKLNPYLLPSDISWAIQKCKAETAQSPLSATAGGSEMVPSHCTRTAERHMSATGEPKALEVDAMDQEPDIQQTGTQPVKSQQPIDQQLGGHHRRSQRRHVNLFQYQQLVDKQCVNKQPEDAQYEDEQLEGQRNHNDDGDTQTPHQSTSQKQTSKQKSHRQFRSHILSSTKTCGCKRQVWSIIATLPRQLNHRLSNERGLSVLNSAYRRGLRNICWKHLRNTAKMSIGLRSSGDKNNREELEYRITYIVSRSSKFDNVRYSKCNWFIKEQQNNLTRLQLVSAKYGRREHWQHNIAVDPLNVWKRYATLDAWREFEEQGTVNVPGTFDFLLNDPEIRAYIDMEFEMYRYHWYLEGASGPNLGWLRNMWFSIIQQAVRQNVVYYALLASARPDRNHWLVSYPYYVKDTASGEKTGFHHLDLNLRRCVESGKGQNIVQGALALDTENEENCTIVVKGFHRKMHQWYKRVEERGDRIPNGETTDLKTLYTVADREEFGDYQPVPCRSGEVRITLPTIPHGSTATATMNRRAIFPWFTGINPDHLHLDNEESEKFDDIAFCHLHRTRCKKSPSGRTANAYLSASGQPFEATVELPFSSYIGDALVGKRKWNTAPVERQCAIIFGKDDMAARREVERIQRAMVDAYHVAFKTLRIEEELQYGDVSFFKWWYGGGRDGTIPRPRADGLSSREPSPDIQSTLESDKGYEHEYSEEGEDTEVSSGSNDIESDGDPEGNW
ncbi:hypothetical protein K440DRAFT_666553 [Wilcoxina mikolae CBS 423.85]|nr:hypothetical protein K440DRAFT_666553 [Wilcoxina mikolae CBS 423.85]